MIRSSLTGVFLAAGLAGAAQAQITEYNQGLGATPFSQPSQEVITGPGRPTHVVTNDGRVLMPVPRVRGAFGTRYPDQAAAQFDPCLSAYNTAAPGYQLWEKGHRELRGALGRTLEPLAGVLDPNRARVNTQIACDMAGVEAAHAADGYTPHEQAWDQYNRMRQAEGQRYMGSRDFERAGSNLLDKLTGGRSNVVGRALGLDK